MATTSSVRYAETVVSSRLTSATRSHCRVGGRPRVHQQGDPSARVQYHVARLASVWLLAGVCAACSGSSPYSMRWDGRRGYDGSGDYGYDVAASNAEARGYRERAALSYQEPGDAENPWGPYLREAAYRFQIPEVWVREVMQQESGGHLYDASNSLITSSVGAMGLMQVMPQTYDVLRQRYGLGSDAYDPHNNILAGAAYIREMYDRYGAPGFLAAYNAGPDRVDAYLTDGTPLPDETVNYLASVAPRLGDVGAAAGPFAAYVGSAAVPDTDPGYLGDRNRAYAGGGIVSGAYTTVSPSPDEGDPSDRAYDGGGLVTAAVPTGALTGQPFVPSPAAPQFTPVAAIQGGWAIQVGAFPNPATSTAAIEMARARAADLLFSARPAIMPIEHGGILYRARLTGLSANNATAACARLTADGVDCFAVPPGS
jgi:D-alanyl-D-alanine carboxypeptidase